MKKNIDWLQEKIENLESEMTNYLNEYEQLKKEILFKISSSPEKSPDKKNTQTKSLAIIVLHIG